MIVLFWGHTRWCSEITTGSEVRNHSWWVQGLIWDANYQPQVSCMQGKKPYPLYYQSFPNCDYLIIRNPKFKPMEKLTLVQQKSITMGKWGKILWKEELGSRNLAQVPNLLLISSVTLAKLLLSESVTISVNELIRSTDLFATFQHKSWRYKSTVKVKRYRQCAFLVY